MKRISVLTAGVSAAVFGATVLAAAPAKKAAPAKASAAPIANYWMDVTTTSGFGAGMGSGAGGAQPDMAQVMAMLSGRGGGVGHALDLRLASKQKAEPGPKASADHWVPAGLQMGPSLPLVTPVREPAPAPTTGLPQNFQQPKGRMLIYWGCGEHVSAGQPTVLDYAKMVAG